MTSWDDTAPPAWDDAPVAAEPRYAGFWIRFVAYLIDVIVLAIVLGLLVVATGVVDVNDNGDSAPTNSDGVGLLVTTVYFVICWGAWQRTLGYRILGLRLVKTDGTPVTWGTAIIRGLMFIVSFIPIFIGLIWAAFNHQKQGWHDKVAGTWVIRDR